MAEFKFIYKKESHTSLVEGKDSVRVLFGTFAEKIHVDLKNLSFYHNKKKINYDENTLIGQQFDLLHNSNCCSDKIIIKITVVKNPFYITFFYNSQEPIPLTANEKDKMKSVFESFAEKAEKDISKIFFLYDGNYFSYESIKSKKVIDFANEKDKKANEMSINVTDSNKGTMETNSKEETMKNNFNEGEENIRPAKLISIEIMNDITYYNIVFYYDGDPYTIQVEKNEKMIDIIRRYTEEKKISLTRLSFLYNGECFVCFNNNDNNVKVFGDKTVEEFANKESKERKGLAIIVCDEDTILLYKEENNGYLPPEPEKTVYDIIFLYNNDPLTLKAEENEKMKDAILRFTEENGIDKTKVSFIYNGELFVYENESNEEVKDFGDKMIKEFANQLDQRRKGMAIIIYNEDTSSINQDSSINIININDDNNIPAEEEQNQFCITFIYDVQSCSLNVDENEKMKDIVKKYTLGLDVNNSKFSFKYDNYLFSYDNKGDNQKNDFDEKTVKEFAN